MDQIDVELVFDEETDDPLYYQSEDGRRWNYDDCFAYDWKDTSNQQKCIRRLSDQGTIITLFDGTDSMIYTLEKS